MNHPEIVSIGIVWDSERPTLDHIMDVFATVRISLRLADVFHSVIDNRWAEMTTHSLVGVVTYYGKHYSTFFFHTKLRVWIYFDDATVREIGPRWEHVVEKCRRGRYQPLLLLYAVPNGTPVNSENAPKQITPFYTDKTNRAVPSQSILRRSITPSPEKPHIGNTRRAITPNPDCSITQKPPLPRSYNDYQNLSVIQDNIYESKKVQSVDCVDGDVGDSDYVTRKRVETIMNMQNNHKLTGGIQVHRTLSNGSSSGVEGLSIPDHMNIPRRRDSGNWSGDRNSASSSSSTTMENPYLYLVGKVPHGNGSVPSSPTRGKYDSSSGSSGVYDAGYDSYSLSSNDSSTVNTIQHLMKMGHLAKIPEDYNNPPVQSSPTCDVLCDEADELLIKSRHLEDEHDLVLALALCNAAATKARAAMNAPYNNPQTLTLARMKHNTCIMRARSLHRRMTQTQVPTNKDIPPEIRHTREGSSGSGRHSRQSSRDKNQHSRQGSRELLSSHSIQEKTSPNKNIEIYATLPKKKDVLKNKVNITIGEDEEYMFYDKPPVRESRSIFSRGKNKDSKVREKRTRSEDRNKMSRDFSVAPDMFNSSKESGRKEKNKEEKEEKKEKEKSGKKQHKIRRKLLMGGLIRRKNRSMPDLTEANSDNDRSLEKPTSSVDDSSIGMKGNDSISAMCGYLSEGHLEFSGNSTNPNLERSRLMRKSFHGSAGKVLTVVKVPPPPPLRTTSQLSKSKLQNSEVCDDNNGLQQTIININNNGYYHQSTENKTTHNSENEYYQNKVENSPSHYQQSNYQTKNERNYYNQYNSGCRRNSQDNSIMQCSNEPTSLPFITPHQNLNQLQNRSEYYDLRSNNFQKQGHTVITKADVHQEQSPIKQEVNSSGYDQNDVGVDEVDCLPTLNSLQNLDLPPYPSPANSVIHSRQPSEEFPPPPPPLDLSALDEHLQEKQETPAPGSLLAQLQNKRLEILSQDHEFKKENTEPVRASGDTWLRELQAKQAALRMKKAINESDSSKKSESLQQTANEKKLEKIASVKDLASKFENITVDGMHTPNSQIQQNAGYLQKGSNYIQQQCSQNQQNGSMNHQNDFQNGRIKSDSLNHNGVLCFKQRTESSCIAPEQIAEELREVEMLNSAVQRAFNSSEHGDEIKKNKLGKKKSVSFCDQVILVEEQEEDSYIPNPILERVLRTAMNKPESAAIRKEIMSLRENELRREEEIKQSEIARSQQDQNCIQQKSVQIQQSVQNPQETPNHQIIQNQVFTRQNSVDNLLSKDECDYRRTSPLPENRYPINQQLLAKQQNIYTNNQSLGMNKPQHLVQNQYQYSPTPQNRPFGQNQYNSQNNGVEYNNQNSLYSSSPRNSYGQVNGSFYQVRQSPVPLQQYCHKNPNNLINTNHNSNTPYQQPPSPSLHNYNMNHVQQQNQFNRQIPQQICIENRQNGPYQTVPYQVDKASNGQQYPSSQKIPEQQYQHQNVSSPYLSNSPYQRVPPPHGVIPEINGIHAINNGSYQRTPYQEQYQRQFVQNSEQINQIGKHPVYQQALPPKQILKKVSFEPGTKGGTESPTPKAIVTPIIVNNVNNNSASSKTKCNLCRKKVVIAPNLYCNDCEFYMSRFKPKT